MSEPRQVVTERPLKAREVEALTFSYTPMVSPRQIAPRDGAAPRTHSSRSSMIGAAVMLMIVATLVWWLRS